MHLQDPAFPPLLAGHPVKAPERALQAAVAGAAEQRLSAGDVTWARDVDRLDMAIVLEPSVPRERAVEMLWVALAAIADSLGALVPPEVGVTVEWPNIVRVNGARAGEIRLVVSPERSFDDVPLWMVLGVTLEIRRKQRPTDPGFDPEQTDLQEEGCGDITRTELVESISRHLLVWTHNWETDGFRPVHDRLGPLLQGRGEEIEFEFGDRRYFGRFVGIDEHGDMIMETASGTILLRAIEIAETPEGVLA